MLTKSEKYVVEKKPLELEKGWSVGQQRQGTTNYSYVYGGKCRVEASWGVFGAYTA